MVCLSCPPTKSGFVPAREASAMSGLHRHRGTTASHLGLGATVILRRGLLIGIHQAIAPQATGWRSDPREQGGESALISGDTTTVQTARATRRRSSVRGPQLDTHWPSVS